jgi:hypothetical protein
MPAYISHVEGAGCASSAVFSAIGAKIANLVAFAQTILFSASTPVLLQITHLLL